MFKNLPELGKPLDQEHLAFLETFTKSCRQAIVQMVVNAQSGHPGGSLSCIDYLAVIYAFIIGQTGEDVIVSNGHISPGIYSSLAEMGWIPRQEVIDTFRKIGSIYEGHVTRHIDGVHYGTGPLGIGASVAAALAHGENLKKTGRKVFALVGDGECQEGQIHEMIQFANKYKLGNLVTFVDYNQVQLTASLAEIMNIEVGKIFEAGNWHVIHVNGHNYQEIWKALAEAYSITDKPTAIIGHTIMGHGVNFMEEAGKNHQADWHGKAPKPDHPGLAETLEKLETTAEEKADLETFRAKFATSKPIHTEFTAPLTKMDIEIGKPITYSADELTDCRTAYGKALADLANHNKNVLALTADLKDSVMTKFVASEKPEQHIEVGIAEQHMISAAGGFSLQGFVPFASTFGAFMTSRAKDQARVNDINQTNVKMVATHCGLSVGEDGPTHQAIDDMGSFVGFFNTMIIEPADPNQTDRIIRYIASHYGNFYVRMGRHKFPNITKEDGSIFYDENYHYEYGRSDLIREGKRLTIAATGAMVHEAIKARELLNDDSIEIIAVSSIKKFDDTLINSIKKTKKVVTIEDHNTHSGLGAQLSRHLTLEKISTKTFEMIGVEAYQLSGKAEELYHAAGIDAEGIAKKLQSL